MASGPEIYLTAGLTILLSALVGAALCARRERGWTWLAPGVGFATVISFAWLAVKLPGDGLTAGLLLVAAAVAAGVRLRGRIAWRSLVVGGPTALLVLAAGSLPFAANRRFGALGPTVNDDFALHLEFADILALGDDAAKSVDVAYPVGPHSLVAAMSDLLGTGIESTFLGVILAVPVIAALTALAALDHLPGRVQPIGATLVGLGYLSAAYLAQASFKESVTALMVLVFTLLAREIVHDRARWRAWIVPVFVVLFAGLSAFSVPAIVWFIAVGAAALVVTMIAERIRPSARIVAGVAVTLVALALSIVAFELITSFFRLGPGRYAFSASEGGPGRGGGNLYGPLSFFETLGVWPNADFRFEPAGDGWRLGVALAVVATAIGVARTAMRRELVLLAATAASVVVYLLVDELSIPYNAAKALVIAAPLIMLVTVAGLLIPPRRPAARLGLAVLAACFAVACAASSTLALRAGNVRPATQEDAFAQVREVVRGKPTLFLGRDNYSAWELRSTWTAYLGFGARAFKSGETPARGAAASLGFDSLNDDERDAADMLVVPNTLYASQPGPEFREVLRTRWYLVYRRERRSPPRSVLRERRRPGAILRCSTPPGRKALRAGGRAFVRPAPVVGPIGAWTFQSGGRAAPDSPVVLAGNREPIRQTIRLPRGRWEISLSWASPIPITLRIAGKEQILPPYLGDGDRHWRVASVRGGRPVEIVMVPGGERRIDVRRGAQIGLVAAVREDVPGRFVPVRRACGRYVDFIER